MFKGSIGEALISASIQVLLERIVSYLLRKKDSDFGGLLWRLRTTASSLAVVPGKAPEAWLDTVQEAMFDADDLLDEIDTDYAIAADSSLRPTKKLKGSEMEGNVRKLVERLEGMAKQKEVLVGLAANKGVHFDRIKMFKGSIGEAFISASIQVLLERIVSYLLRKKDSDFDGLLSRLRTTASSLAAIAGKAPKAWLDTVQEAVFDADDLLDEIDTDYAIAADSSSRPTKRLKGSEMEGKVRKLVERLEGMAKQKEVLVGPAADKAAEEKVARRRLPSSSVVDESEVIGREKEKESAIESLLEEEDGNYQSLAIVGMGGIGKTALAQAVFNDPRVAGHFHLREWVCVSEDFDICRVTAAMLGLGGHSSSLDLNSLQLRLKGKLAGNRFLIVLDDVWNDEYLDWDALKSPFRDAAGGSKLVVTTRSERVASVVSGTRMFRNISLSGLSDEACSRLLAKHAGRRDFSGNEEAAAAREIVRKCDGHPLAIKAVAGLLRSPELDVREWEKVAGSDLWNVPRLRGSVLPALNLSYYYLSPNLKRCFAYCAIFPKSYEFDRDELVLLWMAQNLLESDPASSRRIEELGEEYFEELASRSFFQRSRSRESVFLMHDLLVDLAKSVSEKHCFLSETSGVGASVAEARHFAFLPKQHYPYDSFGSVFRAANRLRTFLPVESMFSCMNLSERVVADLISKLRRLRVLSLSGYKNISLIPDSIGDLKHLRYLNLSSTSITRLPDSTTRLYNLQTLKLACCFRLAELPRDFHRLVNLRHLDISSGGLKQLPESLSLLSNLQTLKISRCRFLTELPREFRRLANLRRLEIEGSNIQGMPIQIRELKSLRTLSTFIVGKETGARIGELSEIRDLQGTLHIKNLQNVENLDDALEARVREKRFLEGLRLEWGKRNRISSIDSELLNSLRPNTNLRKLDLIGYGDSKFPCWLSNRSFSYLVEIFLLNFTHCTRLPPLGELPSLKTLHIRGFDSVARVGSEFYGENNSPEKPFASLEVLEIKQMRKWKEWSPRNIVGAFPKLKRLCLESCNSLVGDLPASLPSLAELVVSMCDLLIPSLPAMPNIVKIELKMCQSLVGVMNSGALESFPRLQRLEISAESASICLDSIPISVKALKIQGYKDLEFRLWSPADSLEELSIQCSDEGRFAPGLTLDSFPNLRILRIGGCQDLASLWSSGAIKSIFVLEITNCHDTDLFPKQSTPIMPSLTSLTARNCTNLSHLSDNLPNLAPRLESLTVKNCGAMTTISKSGPLPETLRWLTLENCDGGLMASRGRWSLRRLGRLSELIISGCDVDDMAIFPEEGLLPIAVTELSIWYLECFETLDSRGLRRLGSLKQLLIYECPNLAGMTDVALPSGLESLRINGCPLLQENCKKDTGKYWPHISHVPWIYFYYNLVT